MNGTYSEFLVIGPKDNFYISFTDKYEYYEVQDNKLKPVFDVYAKFKDSKNIIIDDRLILQICYLSFKYDDVLIYNISDNKIETFIQYIRSKHIKNKVEFISINRLKMIFYLYVFTRIICKSSPFQWNIEKAIAATKGKQYMPSSINVEIIVDYIGHLGIYNTRHNDRELCSIQQYLLITSNETIIPKNMSQHNIIYNILNLSKSRKFLLI